MYIHVDLLQCTCSQGIEAVYIHVDLLQCTCSQGIEAVYIHVDLHVLTKNSIYVRVDLHVFTRNSSCVHVELQVSLRKIEEEGYLLERMSRILLYNNIIIVCIRIDCLNIQGNTN